MVPPDMIVYGVGDVHGEREALRALLERIAEDALRSSARRASLVLLGDYVDRGHDSRGVLEDLCQLMGPDSQAFLPPCFDPPVLLLGNHEEALLSFLQRPEQASDWLRFGGAETLASYGIKPSLTRDPVRCRSLAEALRDRMPESHLDLLRGLKAWHMVGDYLFVHAGIRPGRRILDQKIEDLLWIRDPFLTSTKRHEKIVVHGHTIVPSPEIYPNRIAVDTGAYATGHLNSVRLQRDKVGFISIEQEPLL